MSRNNAPMGTSSAIEDKEKGLHLLIERNFANSTSSHWFKTIIDNVRWYRVKYKSHRFSTECETPCWTTFYGGRKEYAPYTPVPEWLKPLSQQVSAHLGGVPFNAILLRLYFDGDDEIAWHTDGRTFLGPTPTIASLSFGANATFQLRRMLNVWPPTNGGCSQEQCIDTSTSQMNFVLSDGDLLVMKGATQKHWHHRVPKERGRRPRLNVNFRYVLQGPDAERGQKTYYKYMVHGDENEPNSLSFQEIMNKRGGMMKFVQPSRCIQPSFATPIQIHPTSNQLESSKAIEKVKSNETLSLIPESQKDSKVGKHLVARDHETDKCGRPDSSLLEKLEGDSQAYLQAEPDVDASTFQALPYQLRLELINERKQRQRLRKKSTPKQFGALHGKKHIRRQQHIRAYGTLDTFYTKK